MMATAEMSADVVSGFRATVAELAEVKGELVRVTHRLELLSARVDGFLQGMGESAGRQGLKPEELLLPGEAAAMLKLSVSTLAQWRGQGKGPKWVSVGDKAVRYRLADVLAFGETARGGKVG